MNEIIKDITSLLMDKISNNSESKDNLGFDCMYAATDILARYICGCIITEGKDKMEILTLTSSILHVRVENILKTFKDRKQH
jgi:hypothetical protein